MIGVGPLEKRRPRRMSCRSGGGRESRVSVEKLDNCVRTGPGERPLLTWTNCVVQPIQVCVPC
jgi:hypothetical protein